MELGSTNGEFWLPPEFLNDEDIPNSFPTGKPGSNKVTSGFYGFGSYGQHSNLGSPVESVMGSTETESDEEDYLLNGLTRKLANSTLHDDFFNFENKATSVVAGSPQSTLCGCCKNGSSRGSPNCRSPPAAAAEANRNQTSWDLLYAAAGELARMRMVEEAASRYYNPNKSYLASQSSRKIATPDLHYQQLQVAQFQKLKQQQIAKQQYLQMMLQSRARNESGNGRLAAQASSAWLTHQQPQPPQRTSGSGMRAVFLGNPSTKRESTGTGVFLPRQTGAPTELSKKRGCSTVLLPDRVVQALNLNLETMEAESKLQSRCNVVDAEVMYRQRLLMAQQRLNNHQQQPAAVSEYRLPQEWTY